MFPPIDESVLRNNPDFANLYNKLTNVVLNPDGSTKEDPMAKERKRVKAVSRVSQTNGSRPSADLSRNLISTASRQQSNIS